MRPGFRILFTALFAATALAESPTKPPQAAPAFKAVRPEPVEIERDSKPRAPVLGQPFDDRDVSLFLQAQGRELFAAGRLPRLTFERRASFIPLPAIEPAKPGWAAAAARAEAATIVLGEFYRDSKTKKDEFTTAAGAFLISPTGVIVTCLHVVNEKGARGFVALTRDGRVMAVREVLAADPTDDIAILQLDVPAGVTLPALPLATEPAPIGAPVGVMSHPDERFFLFTTGAVGRHTVWRSAAGDEHFMSITADFAKGSSGCPVFDERGTVIGIVNNTESIYYEDDGKKRQFDLQMVVKNATPSWVVHRMVSQKGEAPVPKAEPVIQKAELPAPKGSPATQKAEAARP